MQNPFRLLALGDSYTYGEGVRRTERWPEQVAQRLRIAGWQVSAIRVIAQTGWTTDELLRQLAVSRPGDDFDFVTLMIGVNNQYRGRGLGDFSDELAELAEAAKSYARGRAERLLMISIPDWGATPFAEGKDCRAISEEIDRFNKRVSRRAEEIGASFVDLTMISRERSKLRNWFAADGLHPGAAMHCRWSEAIASELLELITKEGAHG